MWDLTAFPEWICSLKVGANAYAPLSRGSLMEHLMGSSSSGSSNPGNPSQPSNSSNPSTSGDGATSTSGAPGLAPGGSGSMEIEPKGDAMQEELMDEEERALQAAIELSMQAAQPNPPELQ